MEDFTIFQEMKDIVKRSMSQIKYEFHFFFSDLPMSIWTRNMLSKEMWLLCGKETITWKNDEFVKPFLAPKAYGDTETQQLENKKKTPQKTVYISLRTSRVIATHQNFTEYMICFINYNPMYLLSH